MGPGIHGGASGEGTPVNFEGKSVMKIPRREHQGVATRVKADLTDAGKEAAASSSGLDFIALQRERYELVTMTP